MNIGKVATYPVLIGLNIAKKMPETVLLLSSDTYHDCLVADKAVAIGGSLAESLG